MLWRRTPVITDPDTLRAEVERREKVIGLQDSPVLTAVLSERETAAERALAEWTRRQSRGRQRDKLKQQHQAERREQRTVAKLAKADHADRQWLQEALSARRRALTPDAQLARVFRRSTITARVLIGVVVFGMLWASMNVQANLVPDRDPTNPLFWASFGIEAMFSVPLILIMLHSQTAAEIGEKTDRGSIILLELVLLGGSILLNAGPHFVAGENLRGLEHCAAPTMIGVAIWLHAWLANRYALLIGITLDGAAAADPSITVTESAGDPVGGASTLADPITAPGLVAARRADQELPELGNNPSIGELPHHDATLAQRDPAMPEPEGEAVAIPATEVPTKRVPIDPEAIDTEGAPESTAVLATFQTSPGPAHTAVVESAEPVRTALDSRPGAPRVEAPAQPPTNDAVSHGEREEPVEPSFEAEPQIELADRRWEAMRQAALRTNLAPGAGATTASHQEATLAPEQNSHHAPVGATRRIPQSPSPLAPGGASLAPRTSHQDPVLAPVDDPRTSDTASGQEPANIPAPTGATPSAIPEPKPTSRNTSELEQLSPAEEAGSAEPGRTTSEQVVGIEVGQLAPAGANPNATPTDYDPADPAPSTETTPAPEPEAPAEHARTKLAPSADDARQAPHQSLPASVDPRIGLALTTARSLPSMPLAPSASPGASASAAVRALPAPRTGDEADHYEMLAERIRSAGLVTKPTVGQIATALRMLDEGASHAAIGRATAPDGETGGIHHKTIKAIQAAAERIKVPVRVVR